MNDSKPPISYFYISDVKSASEIVSALKTYYSDLVVQNDNTDQSIFLKSFLDLLNDNNTDKIAFVEASTEGSIGAFIASLSNELSLPTERRLEAEKSQPILNYVHSKINRTSDLDYLTFTVIPNLYEWWEKGSSHLEDIGIGDGEVTIVDDKIKGYVKVITP